MPYKIEKAFQMDGKSSDRLEMAINHVPFSFYQSFHPPAQNQPTGTEEVSQEFFPLKVSCFSLISS
jgi:hypothetical protein